MLPENKITTKPVPGIWLYDLGVEPSKVLDFKSGGRGIQDPYAGLDYQVWRGRVFNAGLEDSYIVLDGRFSPEYEFFKHPFITEFNFCFDFNMNPMAVFIADVYEELPNEEILVTPTAYLRWFDTTLGRYDTIELDGTIRTPLMILDDPREIESNYYELSDVCLFYWKSGNLYVRYMRDRFTVEYLLKRNIPHLLRVGMTDQSRIQIELIREKTECQSKRPKSRNRNNR